MQLSRQVIATSGSRRLLAVGFIVAAAASCSSTIDSGPDTFTDPSMLLVTNASCTPGPCTPQRILLFPTGGPNEPGGLWNLDLGLMTGASMCVTIPPKAKFYDIAVPNGGNTANGGDTTTYIWTTFKPASVGAIDTSGSRFTASPSTSEFVPSSSRGWQVTLPAGNKAVEAPACTP